MELCKFFPFHCKYAHSLFWYLGSVLSTPGIRSCDLDLRCRYSFSITNTILSSLSDYSQHFGDKLCLYLVKTDFTLYIPPHITNLLGSHSVGGFGYILPVEHCDYKVPTKSCVPGLLGGSAVVPENPASQIRFRHFLLIWKHCAKPCSILWTRIVLAFLKSHNIIFNNLPN